MTDALIYDNATARLRIDRVLRSGGQAVVVSKNPQAFEAEGVTSYMAVCGRSAPTDFDYPRLYLDDLEDDSLIDRVIERVACGAKLLVRAADDLSAIGRMDVRLHLSPIMLLHKLGVLDGATVCGGIYLDNDDVDLMVQSNARLVLLPSTDIGGGKGIPNTVSYLSRGLQIGLGTGDGEYSLDVRDELKLLELLTNAQMCTPHALKDEFLQAISDFSV